MVGPHALRLTADLAGTDGVLVCGGDSYVNEVVSSLLDRLGRIPCPLGIVPCGHVNALARHLDPELPPNSPTAL